MSISDKLSGLVGTWKCTNRLNFGQENPIIESKCSASVMTRAAGQCLEIAYEWEFEGKPQEGVILLDGIKGTSEMAAVWTDSFHYANTLMMCRGACDENGFVSVTGSYPAPEGPDWHWRTEITPGDGTFKYMMINITPDGEEQWAVEMAFIRA